MRKTNDKLGRDERWNTKEEQAAHDEFWAKVMSQPDSLSAENRRRGYGQKEQDALSEWITASSQGGYVSGL